MKQNAILLRRNSVQGLFNGYNYDITTSAGTSSNIINPHRKNSRVLTTQIPLESNWFGDYLLKGRLGWNVGNLITVDIVK